MKIFVSLAETGAELVDAPREPGVPRRAALFHERGRKRGQDGGEVALQRAAEHESVARRGRREGLGRLQAHAGSLDARVEVLARGQRVALGLGRQRREQAEADQEAPHEASSIR